MLTIRKWIYTLTILAATAIGGAVGFAGGWFTEWWNSPIGEPLCVARGADYVMPMLRELAADYRVYWGVLFGVVGVIFALLLLWLVLEVRALRLARG